MSIYTKKHTRGRLANRDAAQKDAGRGRRAARYLALLDWLYSRVD